MESKIIQKYRESQVSYTCNDEFADIPGYEGFYQISKTGKVKSLIREKLLSQTVNKKNGYASVALKGKTFRVHKLVAITFLNHSPCWYKEVVDHKDNNPLNNSVDNLQLISNRENSSKDKWRHKPSSKYPCVSWNKKLKKWSARVRIKGARYFLGYFHKEIDAHNAVQNRLAES